jgi:hypothetical protein
MTFIHFTRRNESFHYNQPLLFSLDSQCTQGRPVFVIFLFFKKKKKNFPLRREDSGARLSAARSQPHPAPSERRKFQIKRKKALCAGRGKMPFTSDDGWTCVYKTAAGSAMTQIAPASARHPSKKLKNNKFQTIKVPPSGT